VKLSFRLAQYTQHQPGKNLLQLSFAPWHVQVILIFALFLSPIKELLDTCEVFRLETNYISSPVMQHLQSLACFYNL
jgi:hypothetical protein